LNKLQEPAWKQEVNRRVAAHMHGKPTPSEVEEVQHAAATPGSRAAKAAAKVARRFAQAPSYNEMLATEARAAVEAAEAASVAAQEAHAKAQMVLAGIEAASTREAAPEPIPDSFWAPRAGEVVEFALVMREAEATGPLTQREYTAGEFAIRWEPGLTLRESSPEGTRATLGSSLFDAASEEWEQIGPEQAQLEEIAVVEPVLPIFGNVIEFPRQIVATRKVRPRLVEGPLATPAAGAQLSIFEVDPGAVSVEPEVESQVTTQHLADWSVPEWSSIRFARVTESELELLEDPEPERTPTPEIELASLSRRILAGMVDATLVAGACVAAAAMAVSNSNSQPGLKTVEFGTLAALLVATVAYKLLFFTMARATPGMRYARLSLCTFEGGVPTRTQRYARLAALLLSVLPVGLGFVWAIFDDQHLSWHDRISKTYLRIG
jgi:uncharacterized RDD family membrane protein YckC